MTEPEPEYIFIKGKGWHPTRERKILTQDGMGVKIYIIDRLPNTGERFVGYGTDEEEWYDIEADCLNFTGPTRFMNDFNVYNITPLAEGDSATDESYRRACTIVEA